MQRLGDVDSQHELNIEDSKTAEDPIAAKVEDMRQREEGIKTAALVFELKHCKQAPIDFINGEKFLRTTEIDPGMQRRMREHHRKAAEKGLGREIDAMGLDAIDPNYNKPTGLIHKPKDK